MPATLNWDTPQILTVNYHAVIDGHDAVSASTVMSTDPRFKDLIGIIIDTREITANVAKQEHVERLVNLSRVMSELNPRIRNAIILNDDEATESLAALYTILAHELVWEIDMFRTMEEALAWIQQPHAQIQP